jgi:hypothetical protein
MCDILSLSDGEIRYMENGQHVRTEYAETHELHGEIRYFENGERVRIEFASKFVKLVYISDTLSLFLLALSSSIHRFFFKK